MKKFARISTTCIVLVLSVLMGVVYAGTNTGFVVRANAMEIEADLAAEQIMKELAEENTEMVIEEATEESAEEVIEEVTEETNEEVIEEVTEEVIEESTEESAEEVIEEATEENTEEVIEENSEEITEENAEEASEEVCETEEAMEAEDFEAPAEDAVSDTDNEEIETVEVEEPRTAQQIVEEEAAVRGNYARLYINSVGVDVAVFYTDNLNILQSVVDEWDSACMFDWTDGNTMIADHNNQGFENIKASCIGTYAELVTPYNTTGYTCEEIIYDGWNMGDYLSYNDGTPISDYYTQALIIYTCNSDGTITITVWG